MNILLLDIETAPNLAYVWGLFKQNIAPSQVEEAGYVLCWAAKWLGEDHVHFSSIKKSSPKVMMAKIHALLDKADAVVHYNGTKFDIPVLNRELLLHKFNPPAPYSQIDLYHYFKRLFRFESNKLDNITQRLGLGAKASHEGFALWTACMRGDAGAWKRMEAYNRQDVVLLEKLYRRALPWIDKHPSHGTHADIACCPNCGSEEFRRRGYTVTRMQKYRLYQCKNKTCGHYFRGNKTVSLRLPEKMTQIAA